VSDRPDPVVSVILESNYGGIPVTICACAAVLVAGPSAWLHIDNCPAAALHQATLEET
jgi:hypothetical protein